MFLFSSSFSRWITIQDKRPSLRAFVCNIFQSIGPSNDSSFSGRHVGHSVKEFLLLESAHNVEAEDWGEKKKKKSGDKMFRRTLYRVVGRYGITQYRNHVPMEKRVNKRIRGHDRFPDYTFVTIRFFTFNFVPFNSSLFLNKNTSAAAALIVFWCACLLSLLERYTVIFLIYRSFGPIRLSYAKPFSTTLSDVKQYRHSTQ